MPVAFTEYRLRRLQRDGSTVAKGVFGAVMGPHSGTPLVGSTIVIDDG